MKPRVMCSQCDFVGLDGKEMEMHRKKHETSFDCKECEFVANHKIVLRRHEISKHNKKCQSCKFTAATSAALKMHNQAEHGGGLLSNSAGFMITNDAPNGDSNEDMGANEVSNVKYCQEADEVPIFEKRKTSPSGKQVKEKYFEVIQRFFFVLEKEDRQLTKTSWHRGRISYHR